MSPGPACCSQRPRAEQKAKKIKKNPKTKQDRPLTLEQWLSGLELKIEIYGYTVQVRGSRALYTWDRLCTRSQRAAALPLTRFVQKKKKINTTMCLQNNKCCSSRSCRLSPGCQGVSQPGLDVWSEQGGAAVPRDVPAVSWGGCRGGPGSPMAFEGLGGLGSSPCQGWEPHSWHWLLHGSRC